MSLHTRPRHALVPVALAVALLAGCGGGGPAPVPAAATPTAPPAEAVALPWPAADPAAVAALQAGVDRGSQPWLLDRAEVARSYAAAAYGWPTAEAFPHGDDAVVDVRGPGGERATLTLAQPGRTGTGGIWVVTAATRP